MESPGPPTDDPDAALIAALVGGAAAGGDAAGNRLSREQLASEAGLPVPVVEALEREGLIAGSDGTYEQSDVELLRAGRSLLDAGVPLGELLDLARRLDRALRGIADDAVETFVRFVRDPAHADPDHGDAAERLISAYREMLPAASTLVGGHFRHLLLRAARARAVGDDAERDQTEP